MIYGIVNIAPNEAVTVSGDPVTVMGDPLFISSETMVAADVDLLVINTPAIALPDAESLVRVGVYMQSVPGSLSPQAFRVGIFNNAVKLIATSDEVIVPANSPAGWINFSFDDIDAPLLPANDEFYVGLQCGPGSDGVDYFVAGSIAARESYTGSSYADGMPPTLTGLTGTSHTGSVVMFMETIRPLLVSDDVDDDDYIASLPFPVTQTLFGASSPIAGSRVSATCSWYGTTFDATAGANAVVRSDGPLADLVGERIQVTRRGGVGTRRVFVYVSNVLDFPDTESDQDLMLTRRAFLGLGSNALDDLRVEVEVLGA